MLVWRPSLVWICSDELGGSGTLDVTNCCHRQKVRHPLTRIHERVTARKSCGMQTQRLNNWHSGAVVQAAAALFCLASRSFAQTGAPPLSPTNIFAPASTPADSI